MARLKSTPNPEAINSVFQEWVSSPSVFFTDVLGIPKKYIWNKMIELMESVRDNRKTVVKAGHSVSKSFTSARIALWFLYTHYPATVITTAPTHTQVEQILWREIRDAWNSAIVPLAGELTKVKLELEDKWFAFGFSTKPDQGQENATKMQGFHNENILIIFDEAAGILPAIWQAKDGLLTTPGAKFLAIGNPTSAMGDFVDCFNDPSFNHITISVLDTPNYISGFEEVPGLAGYEFEQDIISKYGKESNQYRSRVLGEIPEDDIDALLSLKWIDQAEERGKVETGNMRHIKRGVVWDVADGGDDAHVIKAFENKTEIKQVVLYGKTIEEAEPFVWRLLREIDGNYIVLDADGIGRVATQLLYLAKDKDVTIIPFSGASRDVYETEKFRLRRDEGFWQMREDFERGQISISRNDQQKKELAALRLSDHVRGYITMEKKKLYKARMGFSPNYADTIMMLCAEYDNLPIIEFKKDEYEYVYSDGAYQYAGDPMAV